MLNLVLFDLDGTLTDSRQGIIASIQHALDSLGRPVPPEDSLLWCIGPPLKGSFQRLLGNDAEAERAVALYRERFGAVGLYENQVYEGIPELLANLHSRGMRLAVATSKAEIYATRIVEHFGIERYFESVFGAELTGERSDKTDLIAWALERTGTDRSEVVMIGDRSHDMVGARNNGVAGVGVLYGYGSRAELLDGGARAVVDSPRELGRLLGSG
ncbi:MAG: HAD family hydrolase [Pseudomonadales bacterium]